MEKRRIPLDIIEGKDKLRICAELPGIIEKDINIEISGNILSISAKKPQFNTEEYLLKEIFSGDLYTELRIQRNFDEKRIGAKLRDDGVLVIEIPVISKIKKINIKL